MVASASHRPDPETRETIVSNPHGPPGPAGRRFFDDWSERYDADVARLTDFPFAGYDDVMAAIVDGAEVGVGTTVLDLGTGTGTVAGRFVDAGCKVWATDFSPAMLDRARAKHPEVTFARGALQDPVPAGFPDRYDRIVSGYAFHHLDLDARSAVIRRLAAEQLAPSGRLVIADVSFPTVAARDRARERIGDRWDPTEFYWAADETTAALTGLGVTYEQVSICAGVFVITPDA